VRHLARVFAVLTAALLPWGALLSVPAPAAESRPSACCCGTHGACLCSRLPAKRRCGADACSLRQPVSGEEREQTPPPSPRLAVVAAAARPCIEPTARAEADRFQLPDPPLHPPEPPPPRG
jgi:hypothetical protein